MSNTRSIDFLLGLLRIGLGLFFLWTSVAKIGQLGETAEFLTRSRLLPEICSMPLACIGVGMELVVAVCLLLRRSYRGATAWAAVMCSVYLLLYAQAWARGLQLSCNCLGSSHTIVNYPLETGLRFLLLAAILLLAWDARSPITVRRTRSFDFSDTEGL